MFRIKIMNFHKYRLSNGSLETKVKAQKLNILNTIKIKNAYSKRYN